MKKRFSISAVLMLSNIIGLAVYAAALSVIVYSRIKTDFSDYCDRMSGQFYSYFATISVQCIIA